MQDLAHASAAEAGQLRATLDGLRVLVVEDSWIVAHGFQSMLELLGVEVIGPAATLGDATALANASGFDVAIMDLDLRGEMADELISALHGRGCPVIVVTGHEVRPELAAKTVGVLSKPIRVEALLTRLREVQAGSLHRAPPSAN